MTKKKITVLYHNGGRLANQLWLIANIYAYALEIGGTTNFPFFYAYEKYFNIRSKHLLALIFSFISKLKLIPHSVLFILYSFFAKVILLFKKNVIIAHKDFVVLPPSPVTSNQQQVNNILKSWLSDLTLGGWLFKNPVGLKKYQSSITAFLTIKPQYEKIIRQYFSELPSGHSEIIGVHIRQGDYKRFAGGAYYQNEEQVATLLKKYLETISSERERPLFIICSDGELNFACFDNLDYIVGPNDAVLDLFTLAKCDKIFGSWSTYSAFASFFGSVPFWIMKDGKLIKTNALDVVL